MPRSDTKGSKRVYAHTAMKDASKNPMIHVISSFNMNKALCGHSTHHAKWRATGYYPAERLPDIQNVCKTCIAQMKRMENIA